MHDPELTLRPMTGADVEMAVSLIADAMNDDEGKWARTTMGFHFGCLEQELDDGREYYLWIEDGHPLGIVGLHRYVWGPPENVWLAWFALAPHLQGKGHGRRLLEGIEKRAVDKGYRKFFIETYDHPDFYRAIGFYKAMGFLEDGRIRNYLPDGSAMIVLGKGLQSTTPQY